ncbi:MAG: hypothetical protein ACYCVN_05135 [Acidimicrobiales bacterium]
MAELGASRLFFEVVAEEVGQFGVRWARVRLCSSGREGRQVPEKKGASIL